LSPDSPSSPDNILRKAYTTTIIEAISMMYASPKTVESLRLLRYRRAISTTRIETAAMVGINLKIDFQLIGLLMTTPSFGGFLGDHLRERFEGFPRSDIE
jgi:hypothetical protein